MDDLTPMEPEYREIPPEQPPQTPNYYGTGVHLPQKKSRLPLLLTLLTVLMGLNLVTVAATLFSSSEPSEQHIPPTESLLTVNTDNLNDDAQHNEHTRFEHDDTMTLRGIYDIYATGSVIVSARSEYGYYTATGIILTDDGYILTDAAIASMPGNLAVKLHDGTSCEAVFIGVDSDMAILKIEHAGLSPVSLSPELELRAKRILENILLDSRIPASLQLDVSEIPEPIRIYWGLPEGVIISRLISGSNAYLAGLRPGDVLLRIGRSPISSVSDYVEALSRHSAGETVRIYLYRDGATYYADVCLESES